MDMTVSLRLGACPDDTISSIEPFSFFRDLMFQGGGDRAIPIEFRARTHTHFNRYRQPAKRPIGARRAEMRRKIAVRHDNDQINITALVRQFPGVGAEQNNLLRVELIHEAAGYFCEYVSIERFHSVSIAL